MQQSVSPSSGTMRRYLLQLLMFVPVILYLSAAELSLSLIQNITTCPNLHKLVNISLSGSGYRVTPLGQRTTFSIHVEPIYTRLVGKALDSVLQARLHGTTILAAEIEPSLTNQGVFHVSYTLRDPGEYRLQLRMLWLTGANTEFSAAPRYAREFMQSSIYIDCVFYNETIVVEGNHVFDPMIHRHDQPICTSGNLTGRWVQIKMGHDCPPWACVGNAASVAGLTDLFHFNHGYVWSPWTCNYRLFTPRQFEQCAVHHRIHSIRVVGDSLAREHYQNLVVFLTNHGNRSAIVLPKLFTTGSFPLHLEGGHRLNVTYDHFSTASRVRSIPPGEGLSPTLTHTITTPNTHYNATTYLPHIISTITSSTTSHRCQSYQHGVFKHYFCCQ